MRDEPSLEDSMGAFEAAMGDAQGDAGYGDQQAGGGGTGSPSGSGGQNGNAPTASGSAGGTGTGTGGNGTLTHAEQVAILDAQLERGTGEFDAMILEEQAEQRRAARERAARQSTSVPDEAATGESGGTMAGGGYSTGGGMPGAALPGSGGGGASEVPQNTAKYPPPADIPSGGDDDVVARQLREAAMRETDPAVREKLWEEYRKYKGISN
ncbi:MAG: hypothetical protein V7746_18950 [Halioglobus sp.]